MILGTGSDLLDIRRFEKVMARHGQRFIKRCFTEGEIALAEKRREGGTHIATYAKRYAAKEAVSKALGTGIGAEVFFTDIDVEKDDRGKPFVNLSGKAEKRLKELTPDGQTARIHLALSDEPPLVYAHVIVESISEGL